MSILDQEKVDKIKQYIRWHPRGMTISDLSSKVKMNRNLVAKYLDMLLISGQVEMQTIGTAKVYFLSHRVPISAMLEFSSDYVIVLDTEQRVVQVNEPVLNLLNEKREALIGKKIGEINNPFFSRLPTLEPVKNGQIADEKITEISSVLNGEMLHFRVKLVPTAFEDGGQGVTLIIEDITAKKTYEESLQMSEARYRGIVEDQTEFITRFRPDGTLIFVNDSYARYLGSRPADLLGRYHICGINDEDCAVLNQALRSLDKEHPVTTIECRISDQSGRVCWNLWTIRALFNDEGVVHEYQGVGRDITEKRQAAARINQYISERELFSQKLQEFIELSPDADIYSAIGEGLYELLPGSVLAVNSYDAASNTMVVRGIFGKKERELFARHIGRDFVGVTIYPNVPPPEIYLTGKVYPAPREIYTLYEAAFGYIPKETCDRIEEELNMGNLFSMAFVWQGVIFGSMTFALRKGEKIENIALIETYGRAASIVLQRQVAEDALKQSEARYRAIVEDQTELICRRLPDGTITFVNGALSRYFGKKPEELLGMNFHSLIPAAEQDQVLEGNAADNRFLRNGTYEQRVTLENGAIQWLQWSDNELYDKTGILIEIQSVGKDITLQKDREKEIIIKESVVASSNHAIAITDIMGRVVFANRSFISMMGYEYEHEVIGEPLEKFVQRTGIQDNISQITAAMIHKGEWNGTATARKKDGKEFELEVYASMITEDQHFPRNMIALFNNGNSRTGIKRHIPAIKNSGQSGKQGIAVIDPAGKIIYINRDLLDITGYPEEREILGKSIAFLICNDSIMTTGFSDFMNSRTGGDSWSGEVRITQKDGSSLPTWLSAKRTGDAQGIPCSIQISFRFSSVQISDKMFLKEFPEKIRELIEFIPYPTFVIDSEGRVIAWNRALEPMTNVKRQDVIGTNNYAKAFSFYQGSRPILVDLLGLSAEEVARQYPEVRRYGDSIFIEGFIPLYGGVHGAYLWGKASPLFDPNGNYIGAIESIQDISDWKKMQESFKRMRDEINVTFFEKIQQLRQSLDRSDIRGS